MILICIVVSLYNAMDHKGSVQVDFPPSLSVKVICISLPLQGVIAMSILLCDEQLHGMTMK